MKRELIFSEEGAKYYYTSIIKRYLCLFLFYDYRCLLLEPCDSTARMFGPNLALHIISHVFLNLFQN